MTAPGHEEVSQGPQVQGNFRRWQRRRRRLVLAALAACCHISAGCMRAPSLLLQQLFELWIVAKQERVRYPV